MFLEKILSKNALEAENLLPKAGLMAFCMALVGKCREKFVNLHVQITLLNQYARKLPIVTS